MFSERHTASAFLSWLKSFAPARMQVDRAERWRASCGALFALFITGLATRQTLGPSAAVPMLIAPMGASAVLLYAVPSSPLAQPWAIIGGNLVSALIGVTCARQLGDPLLAAAVAGGASIAAMFALRCLHPPSGAVALTAVLGGPAVQALGYKFVLFPVALNSFLLLLIALGYNNVTGRRYPHAQLVHTSNTHRTSDLPAIDRLGFKPEDLDEVLKQYNQVLDVSRDDLEDIFLQTEMHAYRRRFGEITCADVMSRDVVTVEYGATLEEAWTLLREHHVKALPVIDRARRVIGIVTVMDFMRHADLDLHEGFDDKLRRMIRRTLHTHSDKPEVVGQIMTKAVQTAAHDAHIVELVPMLSDKGKHHVPVVDGERRLAGMLTQSDLVAALYRGKLTGTEIVA